MLLQYFNALNVTVLVHSIVSTFLIILGGNICAKICCFWHMLVYI